MTRTLPRLLLAAILGAGLLAVPATAAAAGVDTGDGSTGTSDAKPWAEGRFKLVLKPESGPTVAVSLRCTPEGGSHPGAAAACADLDEADGYIADVAPASGFCTKEFAPVTAAAAGVWDGGLRIYKRHFANECEAVRLTGGAVFDFS